MSEPGVATKKMIEDLFDGAAASYDRTGPRVFALFGARLAAHAPLAPGMRVLDVATGTGAVLLPAARLVGAEGRVVGVDLSDAILREADRAARSEGLANYELRKMDAERLEFPDETFDAVTCAFALFLFPDIEGALREMRRVCKPGGYVGVSVFDKEPVPFSPAWPALFRRIKACRSGVKMPQPTAYAPDEVERILRRSGFGSVQIRSETYGVVYGSLEEWWAFQLTVGPRPTILGMDEATRARFKEEYLAELLPMLHEDGLHLSVASVYAFARRE